METYDESPAIPLVDENVKIDDVMEKFEKREDEMNSMESDEKKAREDKRFKLVETSLLKKGSLPGAVRFKGVYTSGEGKTVTGGAPWVDIQPGGFVPKTIVYLGTDDEHVYSIILEPLGGRSRVEKGEVRPDET